MNNTLDSNNNLARTTREYEFTLRDFERVKNLIYQRAGITLSSSKHNMV